MLPSTPSPEHDSPESLKFKWSSMAIRPRHVQRCAHTHQGYILPDPNRSVESQGAVTVALQGPCQVLDDDSVLGGDGTDLCQEDGTKVGLVAPDKEASFPAVRDHEETSIRPVGAVNEANILDSRIKKYRSLPLADRLADDLEVRHGNTRVLGPLWHNQARIIEQRRIGQIDQEIRQGRIASALDPDNRPAGRQPKDLFQPQSQGLDQFFSTGGQVSGPRWVT